MSNLNYPRLARLLFQVLVIKNWKSVFSAKHAENAKFLIFRGSNSPMST